jgi:hypothetical protein
MDEEATRYSPGGGGAAETGDHDVHVQADAGMKPRRNGSGQTILGGIMRRQKIVKAR